MQSTDYAELLDFAHTIPEPCPPLNSVLPIELSTSLLDTFSQRWLCNVESREVRVRVRVLELRWLCSAESREVACQGESQREQCGSEALLQADQSPDRAKSGAT